jgi:hypothetical protein
MATLLPVGTRVAAVRGSEVRLMFFEKCPPPEEQPWSKIPGFNRFSGLSDELSFYRTAQLHGHDGEPLVMDFFTKPPNDWANEANSELREAGYTLSIRPGSGTCWIRQPITHEEALAMAEAVELSLDDIMAQAQAES